jgi:hypothetical protein
MKKILVIALGISMMSKMCFAQQNLFNIPSGDITPKGKIFYQHQINVYTNKFESKGHFVYGLGKQFDAGVNIVGTGAYFKPEFKPMYNSDFSEGAALSPTVMLTLQKQFVINEHITANIGTQAGVNLTGDASRIQPAYFHYGLVGYQFKPGKKILVGPYYTNNQYVGQGNRAGIHAGYEWKLAKKFYLMGDFISGSHESSVTVTGVMYNVSKRVQLCMGYMIPNPNSIKKQGLVFEFNWYGWDAL